MTRRHLRYPNDTVFPWALWQWTEGDESLFELEYYDLLMFRQFVELAVASESPSGRETVGSAASAAAASAAASSTF